MKPAIAVFVLAIMLATAVHADDLATDALGVLRRHCFECHGAKRESDPRYDVTDARYLTSSVTRLAVPGRPAESRILQRIAAREMPPDSRDPLTAAEVAALTRWIEAGAKPWPQPATRPAKGSAYVERFIGEDILNQGTAATNHRYLSLVNLFDDGATEAELETTRQAVYRIVNSLLPIRARGPRGAARVILLDDAGLVLAIDLAECGWTPTQWRRLVELYPYPNGLTHVRADWFCSTVTRDPLYYEFLGMPASELAFEKMIGVSREAKPIRAANNDSEVSAHARLFLRREGTNGPHWKALNVVDEKDGRGSLAPGTPFKQDYALHLFTLANGFPGFAIFEHDKNPADGRRETDVDPRAEIDPTRLGRTATIEIAYKCMACHSHVVQTNIRDVLRETPQADLTRILEADKAKFLQVVGAGEPLRPVIDRYSRPLDLAGAAADCGGSDANALASLISNRTELQAMGLRPLLFGRTVTRQLWQDGPARRVAELLKGK